MPARQRNQQQQAAPAAPDDPVVAVGALTEYDQVRGAMAAPLNRMHLDPRVLQKSLLLQTRAMELNPNCTDRHILETFKGARALNKHPDVGIASLQTAELMLHVIQMMGDWLGAMTPGENAVRVVDPRPIAYPAAAPGQEREPPPVDPVKRSFQPQDPQVLRDVMASCEHPEHIEKCRRITTDVALMAQHGEAPWKSDDMAHGDCAIVPPTISGAPRAEKSQLMVQMALLARRMGFIVMIGVAPNVHTVSEEIQSKFERLGEWAEGEGAAGMFGRCISLDGAKAKLPQDEDYGMIVFSTEHGKHCEQVRSYIDKYGVVLKASARHPDGGWRGAIDMVKYGGTNKKHFFLIIDEAQTMSRAGAEKQLEKLQQCVTQHEDLVQQRDDLNAQIQAGALAADELLNAQRRLHNLEVRGGEIDQAELEKGEAQAKYDSKLQSSCQEHIRALLPSSRCFKLFVSATLGPMLLERQLLGSNLLPRALRLQLDVGQLRGVPPPLMPPMLNHAGADKILTVAYDPHHPDAPYGPAQRRAMFKKLMIEVYDEQIALATKYNSQELVQAANAQKRLVSAYVNRLDDEHFTNEFLIDGKLLSVFGGNLLSKASVRVPHLTIPATDKRPAMHKSLKLLMNGNRQLCAQAKNINNVGHALCYVDHLIRKSVSSLSDSDDPSGTKIFDMTVVCPCTTASSEVAGHAGTMFHFAKHIIDFLIAAKRPGIVAVWSSVAKKDEALRPVFGDVVADSEQMRHKKVDGHKYEKTCPVTIFVVRADDNGDFELQKMPNPGKGIKDVITVLRDNTRTIEAMSRYKVFLVGYTMFGGAITLTDYQKQMPSAAMDQDGLPVTVPVLFCPKQMIIATTSTRDVAAIYQIVGRIFNAFYFKVSNFFLRVLASQSTFSNTIACAFAEDAMAKEWGSSHPGGDEPDDAEDPPSEDEDMAPEEVVAPEIVPEVAAAVDEPDEPAIGAIVPYDGAAPAQRAFGANEDWRQPAARDVLAVNRYRKQRTIRDGQRAYVGAWNAAGELSLNPSVRPTPITKARVGRKQSTIAQAQGQRAMARRNIKFHQQFKFGDLQAQVEAERLERDARRPPPDAAAPPPANDVHPNAVGFPIWATVAVDVNGRVLRRLAPWAVSNGVPAEDADQADEHGIVAHNLEDAKHAVRRRLIRNGKSPKHYWDILFGPASGHLSISEVDVAASNRLILYPEQLPQSDDDPQWINDAAPFWVRMQTPRDGERPYVDHRRVNAIKFLRSGFAAEMRAMAARMDCPVSEVPTSALFTNDRPPAPAEMRNPNPVRAAAAGAAVRLREQAHDERNVRQRHDDPAWQPPPINMEQHAMPEELDM